MKRIKIGALFACLSMSSVALAQQTPEQTPPPEPPSTTPETTPQTPPPVVEPAPQPNTTIIENQQPAPQPTTVIEPTPPPPPVVVQPTQRHDFMSTQVGVEVGGGYADFTPSSSMENATNGGGAWDVRLLLGAHSPLGVELGYVGTANGLHTAGTLTSNAAEGNLRLGTPGWIRMPVQIYGFAGAGINRWDVVNSAGSTSGGVVSFREQDTNFVLPFGGGFQFNLDPHFSLDTRFTYRAMFDANVAGRKDSDLDMITATARLGYIF
jgi:opacity protein-like surface antigen